MAKYTIVIDTDANPDAEEGLQRVTGEYNATKQDTDPILTPEEYLTRVLQIAVESYAQKAIKDELEELGEKFEKASPTEREAVRDALADVVVDDGAGVATGGGVRKLSPSSENLKVVEPRK